MRALLLLSLLLASGNAMAITWIYKVSVHSEHPTGDRTPMRPVGPEKRVLDVIGIPCELTQADGKFRNVICHFSPTAKAEIGIGCDRPGNQPLEMMFITNNGQNATIMLGCDL